MRSGYEGRHAAAPTRRRRRGLIAATGVGALIVVAMPTASFADSVGLEALSSGSTTLNLGSVCAGVAKSSAADDVIIRLVSNPSSPQFVDDTAVSISAAGASGSGLTGTSDSFTVPSGFAASDSGTKSTDIDSSAYGTSTVTLNTSTTGAYSKTITYTATQGGLSKSADLTVTATVSTCSTTNHAPTVATAASDADGTEGDTLTASGDFDDADSDTLTLSADNTEGTFTPGSNGSWSWSLATTDDVAGGTITVTANDGHGGTTTDDFHYSAVNANPAISSATFASSSGSCPTVGSTTPNATLNVAWTDAGSSDTEHLLLDWDNDNVYEDAQPLIATGTTSPLAATHLFSTVGSHTVNVKVEDDDGGVSASSSATFTVKYNMSGILAPVNANGSSTFKSGSTVPVKVSITDCSGTPYNGASPTLAITKVSSSDPDTTVNETVDSTIKSDTGTTLRWDGTSQYIYNLATKSLQDQSATYTMTVSWAGAIPSSVSQTFHVKLK